MASNLWLCLPVSPNYQITALFLSSLEIRWSNMIQVFITGSCKVKSIFILILRRDLLFVVTFFFLQVYSGAFQSQSDIWDHNKLNAETNLRIQLSIKPDIKEICKKKSKTMPLFQFFCFEKHNIFIKTVLFVLISSEFTDIILKWIF